MNDELEFELEPEPGADPQALLPSDPRERRLDRLIVLALWVVGTLVIWQLAIGHVSPRRFQDEFLWFGVAKSFAAGDWLHWRGVSLGIKSPLYVLGIAPAFWLGGSIKTIYHTIHFIDAAMMCAVVFPVFYGARRFVDRAPSFIAALLAVSVPAMNYTGIIGTESLAYPIAAFAFMRIVLVSAQPNRRNWLWAIAGVLLAGLVRTQFVIFAPILFGSVVLAGLMREPQERRAYFRQQRVPLLTVLGLLALVSIALVVSPGRFVGLYAGAVNTDFPAFDELWYWIRGFSADVFIVAGVLPVIAAIGMILGRDNRRDPMIGALLATAFIASLIFVAEVSWFSAHNLYQWRERNVFYERYMFYLAPLFLIAFVSCWRRLTALRVAIATAISTVVLFGLSSQAILVPFSYDAFGLTVLGWQIDAHPALAQHVGLYLALFGAAMGALLLLTTVKNEQVARIGMLVCVIATLATLLVGQAKTWDYARLYSPIAFQSVPKPVSWIDQHAKQPVGMIVTSTDAPEMYFTSEFWNRRITRVFATDAAPIQSPVMYSPRCAFDWGQDGTILGTGCDEVPSAFYMRSNTVAIHMKNPTYEFRLTPDQRLFAAKAPAQMLSILSGRDVKTGQVTGTMSLRTFAELRSTLVVKVRNSGTAGRMTVDGQKYELPAGQTRQISLPIDAGERLTDFVFKANDGSDAAVEVKTVKLRLRSGRVYDLR
ncbi:MAG: hypothetical protein JHC87_00265 [Thermoleophilaceae bacterium]|nr:hypothetical protein [Thermoleophilaceae bacterium]